MDIITIVRWAIFVTFICNITIGPISVIWLFILEKRLRESVKNIDSRLSSIEDKASIKDDRLT